MITAIIVVSIILALGLVALFVTVGIMWHRSYPKLLPNGQPRPKQTVKEWFINHKPSKRRLIQVYAALLTNANIKGFVSGEIYKSETTKYVCVPGLNCYSCPGAVGACPMGALQNALAETNTSAPYYVLGILGIFGLTLARTICGFLCPVGLAQDLLYKVRTPKVKKSRATRVLSYFKYVVLAVLVIAIPLIYAVWNMPMPGFCKYICPAGTFGGAIMLLLNPSNAALFSNLGPLFTWKFCLMVAIIAAAIFIYRFFCRFLCPLGAIYGFFNRIALLGVKVDKENCTNCGLCVSHCKMDVKRVGDHECINCGECISVCPTQAIRWKGSKIFVHANTAELPQAEEKPLAGFVPAAESAQPVLAAQTPLTGFSGDASYSEPVTEGSEASAAVTTVKKPKKTARFWTELAAWIAAIALLLGALVYYNFIDVKKPYIPPDTNTGYEIGDTAPDFTLQRLGADGTFNLYEHRGKVTIVNFWATWCTPCKAELPYFNELSAMHTEWNMIAIHGTLAGGSPEDYIAQNCADWTLPFAQDNLDGATCLTYTALGGRGSWPLTVIVDEEGVILYNSTQPFHSYEDLETAVLNAIASGKNE